MYKDEDIYAIAYKHGSHGIEYVKCMLGLLGNPELSFKYIHVAGTNGKGSVCSFLNGILTSAGLKVGLFTSPHLVNVAERIIFNGEKIDNTILLNYLNRIKDIALDNSMDVPGFFEYMYLAAMLYFKDMGAEYGIIEAGLGGLYDITNVIEKPEITVIVSISKEHEERLGNTISEITNHKAGIIKKGVPLVYDGCAFESSLIIENKAKEMGAEAFPITSKMCQSPSIRGKYIDFSFDNRYHKTYQITIESEALYQCNNAMIAARAAEVMGISEAYIKEGLGKAKWKGRFDRVSEWLYTDGAHNIGGMEAFARSAEKAFSDKGIYIVFACAKDKNHSKMLELLAKLKCVKGMIFTKVDETRGADPKMLLQEAKELHSGFLAAEEDAKKAIQLAHSCIKDGEVVVAVGSLYLTGKVFEIAEDAK